MRKKDNEALFELVREAPTELSQEKVMQIIGTLPTLPPPTGNSWFNNINLNSIIMTTTTVAIIASAVIYFSSLKTESTVPGQDLVSPLKIETTDPVVPVPTSEDSTEIVQSDTRPLIVPNQTEEQTEPLEQNTDQPVTAQKALITTQTAKKRPMSDSIGPAPGTRPSSASNPTHSASAHVTDPITASVVNESKPVIVKDTKPRAHKDLDKLRLKRLKRTLLRELSRDFIIKSKRSLNVLHFKEGEIFVNNQRLNYEEYIKYSELLFRFRIEPGPEKRVVTDPKFVMVGSFTDKGFKGSAQGRAMNIRFVDDAVIFNGLLEPNGGRNDSLQRMVFMDLPEGEPQDGDILISSETKNKEAKVNTSLLGRTLSDSGLGQQTNQKWENVTFKNASTLSTIHDGREAEGIVKIKTKQLKSFKKELYRLLAYHEQVDSNSQPVVMNISSEAFDVNGQDAIKGKPWRMYFNLLKKYGITPQNNRKILMNPDFIMIGDFVNGAFNGTVQGNIDKEKFKGTLLEKELKSTNLFVEDEAEETNDELSSADEDNPRKLSSQQIKGLKKDLYDYLVRDGFIKSRTEHVLMRIEKQGMSVNESYWLDSAMRKRYTRLLLKHRVRPEDDKKVMMTPNFIMVGTFIDGHFNGNFQGKYRSQALKGSILEDAIVKQSPYDARSRMVSPDGAYLGDFTTELETATEVREIAPFERLEVSGLAVVYLEQGAHSAARIDVTGISLNEVITESKNGTLQISTSVGEVSGESIAIHITSPEVYSIQTDGAAEVFSKGKFKADILKLISQGSGSIEMEVDVHRLHLQMDGGDIHLEGKATMEKVDFLSESDRGTLDQSGLNVTERWTHEGGSTWSEQNLPELRHQLLSKLIDQGYISTLNNPASIRFFNGKMTVNDQEIAPNYIDEYRNLYSSYGLPTHANSRLWIDPDFMVIAEKDGQTFELEVMGTELELNIEGSWEELEQAIIHRN